jgi:Arc/MetJ-type ribon-helix-helix transcriptional regulator
MPLECVTGPPKCLILKKIEGSATMNIEIHAPELERLMQEEIQRGHFQSVDDLITQALQALREKSARDAMNMPREEKSDLVSFFRQSPFVGLELEFERDKDIGRDIVL